MGVGDRPWLLRGALLGLALVVGVVAWLANRDSGEDEKTAAAVSGPRIVSTTELQDLAGRGESPIYWVGPMPGKSIELSKKEGGTSIRYLDKGAEVGKRRGAFLTVVTFPMDKPAAALRRFAAEPGVVIRTAPNGRRLFTSKSGPTNYYFAGPDGKTQVEIYDPSPRRSFRLASSEEVQPVE
jgi:hypothetical protein